MISISGSLVMHCLHCLLVHPYLKASKSSLQLLGINKPSTVANHFDVSGANSSSEVQTFHNLQSLSSEVSESMEPLSITASVVSVTSLAYKSCKVLRDIIKGLRNAPDTLKALYNALETFENVVKSLQHDLDGLEDAALSTDEKDSMRVLEPVMRYCNLVCDTFATRLAELTSHSDAGHITWIDRFRLHFNDSDIHVLKENLARCQRTLSDTMSLATLYVLRRK